MKILGHIHTFNDEEIIDLSLEALLVQTYSVDRIVVVDNGSTDNTVRRPFPPHVVVIQHRQNLGTSYAVKTGLQYALVNQYDWMWVLDADSLPREDALQKLVALYESFDLETRSHIGLLSCSQVLTPSTTLFHGRCLTPGGPRLPKSDSNQLYCECDSTIWSGSLFSLQAVRVVGLPRCGEMGCWEDLSLDYGDLEFSYRIRRAGYKVVVHRFSIIDHAVGKTKEVRVLGFPLVTTNHSAARRYLFFRNLVYFWLYLYPRRNWVMLGVWFAYRVGLTILGILIGEQDRARKMLACGRGVWDGLRKNLHNRWE